MTVIESVSIARFWWLLFKLADASVDTVESTSFSLTGRFVLPDPDLGDCWADRLVDRLEEKAGVAHLGEE